ncbi:MULTISPECIES: hypothetical protein [Cupriavidus]
MNKFVIPVVAVASIASCAAAPVVGAPLTLTGEIQIKGNEPFPMVVLQTDDHAVWELRDFPMTEARQLAGQRATVAGTVLRVPGTNTWMPALKVQGAPAATR